ncbi:hypothetical protein D9M68_342760 [compost metagenome]
MTERIPAKIVETIAPNRPVRLTPAQAGGPIHTRSFTGLYRNLRLPDGGGNQGWLWWEAALSDRASPAAEQGR